MPMIIAENKQVLSASTYVSNLVGNFCHHLQTIYVLSLKMTEQKVRL